MAASAFVSSNLNLGIARRAILRRSLQEPFHFGSELCGQRVCHEPLAQPRQDARQELIVLNSAAVATLQLSLGLAPESAVTVLAADRAVVPLAAGRGRHAGSLDCAAK